MAARWPRAVRTQPRLPPWHGRSPSRLGFGGASELRPDSSAPGSSFAEYTDRCGDVGPVGRGGEGVDRGRDMHGIRRDVDDLVPLPPRQPGVGEAASRSAPRGSCLGAAAPAGEARDGCPGSAPPSRRIRPPSASRSRRSTSTSRQRDHPARSPARGPPGLLRADGAGEGCRAALRGWRHADHRRRLKAHRSLRDVVLPLGPLPPSPVRTDPESRTPYRALRLLSAAGAGSSSSPRWRRKGASLSLL